MNDILQSIFLSTNEFNDLEKQIRVEIISKEDEKGTRYRIAKLKIGNVTQLTIFEHNTFGAN